MMNVHHLCGMDNRYVDEVSKMKYALIGCGRVAPNHVTAAKANGLDFVALCDIDEAAAVQFRKDNGLDESVKIYTDFEEMFQKEELDLVAIATISGEHARIARAAIAHKIHVIIEKPIALSIQDADAIIAEAKEQGVLVCTNHQNRFNPAIRAIHDAVESGKMGKILYGSAAVRWFRGESYYQQASWRGTWAQDGGTLMNQCIHDIDLLIWMMGDQPTEVFGFTTNQTHPYIEGEDLGLAVVKFADGKLGKIEGTTSVYPYGLEETLTVMGETGTVRAGGMSVNHIDVWNVKGEEDRLEELQKQCNEDPENVYGNGHTPLYRDMIRAINEGGRPLVDGEAGRRALEVILAIYKASRTGEMVRLPLKEASTLDEVK